MKNVKYLIKNNSNLIFYVFIFLLFIGNVILINRSVWIDEIFTLDTINLNLSDMMDVLIGDVHPPLYYLILKFFQLFVGQNIYVFKFLCIIPTFLTIIIVHLFLNQHQNLNRNSNIISYLFALLLGLSFPFINYSLEIRMYSFAMLFVTCSGLFAYEVYEKQDFCHWCFFIIFSLLAAYTHYFSLILEVFIYAYLFLFLLWKKRITLKKCIGVSFVTLLGYLPWVFFFIKQFTSVRENYWITFGLSNLLEWFQFVFLNLHPLFWILILIVIGTSFIKLVFKKYSQNQKEGILLGLSFVSLPFLLMLVALLLVFLIRPLFVTRYMLPSLGLFYLGVFILLNSFGHRKIFNIIATFVVLINIFFSYPKLFKEETDSPTFKTVSDVNLLITEGDLFVTNMSHFISFLGKYYFHQDDIKDLSVFLENIDLYQNSSQTIWYFDDKNDPGIQKLSNNLFDVTLMYEGNIDYNYFFDLYKITMK